MGTEWQDVRAARDEALSLRCEVVVADPSEAVRFWWTFNGTKGDVLLITNSRIHSKAQQSVIEYKPSGDVDYGTLACWSSNSIGRQKTPCVYNILPASEFL